MNLSWLSTFLTILETGSLVQAAQRLNVTQSTVTARLKALEDHLGQTLITRSKSGATPTGSGLRLKRYAETITGLWSQARQETALPTSVSSVCNIGCHPDLWPGMTQRLFDFIRATEPDAALSVWQGGQHELALWQREGLVDLTLTYWAPSDPTQDIHQLAPDHLILVSTRPDAPIRFDPGYVFVEAGEDFGRQHAIAYADADTARISFGSALLGLEHILQHGGTAYLPDRIAAAYVKDGRLHRLDQAPAFERPIFMAINRQASTSWAWLQDGLDLMQTL
ncbi:MAG: LysR family transcriptional regulator [Pseudomonadota bacterium]